MKLGGVRLRFPKWADSAPPVSRRPKSPGLLGLIINDHAKKKLHSFQTGT